MTPQSSTVKAEEQVGTETEQGTDQEKRPKQQPRYNVILWDDDEHSYDYVIRMMQDLFRHSFERGYQLACEVDNAGRTICMTTTLEHAELKRDQVHAFGKDRLISACAGSMSCSLEPVD